MIQQRKRGILSDRDFVLLLEQEVVRAPLPIEARQLQPASLDLRLGARAYKVKSSFLPGPRNTVLEKMEQLQCDCLDLTEGAVFETGSVYIIPLLEEVNFPCFLEGHTNAKSSTGRLDAFSRVITDYGQEFDKIPGGYKGGLYLELSPQTFPLIARLGSRLTQLRIAQGQTHLSLRELECLQQEQKLINRCNASIDPHGIAFCVNLKNEDSGAPVGYRAKRHCAPIDVDKEGACAPLEYWDPLYLDADAAGLILEPGEFYILASQETVKIPPDFAAEMCPFDPLVGEFRVHYAGFFDPGFGYTETEADSGARAVLEVRSRDVPFYIDHGQVMGRLLYHYMRSTPEQLYGKKSLGSQYQGQGLRLSKHFFSAS